MLHKEEQLCQLQRYHHLNANYRGGLRSSGALGTIFLYENVLKFSKKGAFPRNRVLFSLKKKCVYKQAFLSIKAFTVYAGSLLRAPL